jgi:hypothetical protein
MRKSLKAFSPLFFCPPRMNFAGVFACWAPRFRELAFSKRHPVPPWTGWTFHFSSMALQPNL